MRIWGGKHMKVILGIILFSIVFPINEEENISFQYGMLGRLESNNNQIIELQDSSTLYTGDEVRINAGYQKGTYFYVIYKGSEGEFAILYPEEKEKVVDIAELPDTIYPTILNWSKLTDPPGYESFFMINSNFELENLLVLFKRYNKVNEKDKMELAVQIQDEIDKWGGTQDLASSSNRMDAVVVGGLTFRGDDDGGLKDMSLTHSCKGEFGIAFKKIIINHQ